MNSCIDCNDGEEKKSSRFRKTRSFLHDLPGRSFTGNSSRTSDLTRDHCDRIFQFMAEKPEKPLDRSNLQDIQTMINRTPKGDNIFEPLDEKGWNILQKAVIGNHVQVVSMLIAKGMDLNAGSCSLPLHLACKLGHAGIAEMLLDNGAKADLSKGVCYPVSHFLKPAVPGTSHTARSTKFRCLQVRNPLQPLQCAIQNDKEEVARVLLTHRNSREIVKRDYILHEACKCRAKKCLEILVEMMPEQVNVRDKKEGHTPLHCALRSFKNRESAVILLKSTAHFSSEIFDTEYGTLLHELYVSDDKSFIFQLTELMLKKGPDDFASRTTKGDGDTHLHKLLKFFGGSVPRDEEGYMYEFRRCLIQLLDHGCDVNQINKKGETAFHSLLTHHGGRPLFYIRDRFGVGPQYLSFLLRNICILLEVLLKRRHSNPNIMVPPNVVSPLYYLMRIVCAMSPNILNVTSEPVKRCITLLCANGADPNIINACEDNVMTLLLGSLSRWLYHASDDPSRLESLLVFTEETLQLFLQYGLNPRIILKKNLKQFVIIFNSTILDEGFIKHLNKLLKTVVRFGGNPNMINLNDLHGGMGLPHSFATKYTVGYYLARGLYIHARYHNPAAFDILDVFRNTLSQELLTKCVGGICANLEVEFENGTQNIDIQQRIKSLCEQPRSLKQLSRIAIYSAIDWKIAKTCHTLPIPSAMALYLMDID